ncbi:MAG: bifunctional demethylmenaquinone methyltransferase/2-methoxy-6-polyprenyl-1,4-benzoquinol methylase UbiE [Candidatus Zixiibacteriota bacterium]
MTKDQPETQPSGLPRLSRHQVWKMFDRIAGRYDLLNHLLSAGLDYRWRAEVARMLPSGLSLAVLDLACGTGDQLIALAKTGRVSRGNGLDLAEQMLAIGRAKIKRQKLDQVLELQIGDAEKLAFDDNAFDTVTISFGIRNMTDTRRTLAEMLRVLKPRGRALILEFSVPPSPLVRGSYMFYLRHVMPRLGALISGDSTAYRYLSETIETFPYGDAFCGMMREAGFAQVNATTLTGGIVTIYSGDKS